MSFVTSGQDMAPHSDAVAFVGCLEMTGPIILAMLAMLLLVAAGSGGNGGGT